MLFNSYIFVLIFLPLVLLGYFGLNHFKQYKLAMIFMVGISLCFCGYQNIYYVIVLLVSMIMNYLAYRFMKEFKEISRATKVDARKIVLFAGVLVNVGLLFLCKYYDFFIANLNNVFKTNIPFLELLLPLGISFYTFGQIAFLVDAYRRECEDYSLLEYIAYVSFFPKLLQGPIAYHNEIIPQFRNEQNKKLNYEHLCKGFYAFALGMAKKVLIADTVAKIVNSGYGDIVSLNTPSVILVMISYSLQIYFDFSGYCDMAIGIALMLNIELPINFNSPYKAVSISDFWDRWHITLTRFFTKYIYIPLGGNRKGRIRTYVNIMIVFLVSGLWHGANWTFIVWGAFNGLMIVFERWMKVSEWKLPCWLKASIAFILTTFAWSIFRASSFGEVWLLWQRLFIGGFSEIYLPISKAFQEIIEMRALYRMGLGTVISNYPGLFPILFVTIVVIACVTMRNTQEKINKMKLSTGKLLAVVGLMIWSIISLAEINEFIYINF